LAGAEFTGNNAVPGALSRSGGPPATRQPRTDEVAVGNLSQPDCVFIALHGGSGEDGTLQAILDLAHVSYTGSGMFASAVAMDKYRSKIIFEGVGIPTPKLRFFGTAAEAREFVATAAAVQGPPLVVKPNAQGSTVGLSIVREHSELSAAVQLAADYDGHILIEDYIAGRELTVAVLGDQALPVVEIIPRSGFYDYRAKYTAGESTYVCPAELEPDVTTRIKDYALLAFKTLGCFGYARVDFRLDQEHRLFCLELNTLPGMTSTSLVPKAARAAGMTFAQLLQRIVRLALDKETTKA
jgi:D-alanine-D-alanine ligase